MLKIKPIEDKAAQQRYSIFCKADYFPESLAYSCHDGDRFVGMCQFHLEGEKAVIDNLVNSLDSEDEGALFIMARAALNFADLNGFHDAFYLNVTNEKLAKMIGFTQNTDGDWVMNLRGFFNSPCSHDKN